MDEKVIPVMTQVFAGESDGSVFEELPARQVGAATYELLSSPGLALNMARGYVISIENRNTHAVVLERGGNFCIHIYADHIPAENIAGLERYVGRELGGTLDGVFKGSLSLAVPASNGMDKINAFLIGSAIAPGFNGTTRTSIKIWMMMTRRFWMVGSKTEATEPSIELASRGLL